VKLLDIKNLRVYFEAEGGIVKANDGVSLELGESEILGLIGETGCGKSILGRVVMRLLSEKARVEGRLLYKGQDLLTLPENKMRLFRGKEIGIMLQNPAQALNPVLTVGEQLAEIYRFHEGLREREAKEKPELCSNVLESSPIGLENTRINSAGVCSRELCLQLILLVEQNARIALRVAQRAYVLETGRIALSGESLELRRDPRSATGLPWDQVGGRPPMGSTPDVLRSRRPVPGELVSGNTFLLHP